MTARTSLSVGVLVLVKGTNEVRLDILSATLYRVAFNVFVFVVECIDTRAVLRAV